jgi:hypothetical protein
MYPEMFWLPTTNNLGRKNSTKQADSAGNGHGGDIVKEDLYEYLNGQ